MNNLPDRGKILIFLVIIGLHGCTFTEEIETPTLPLALIEPLPIKVGVYFDDAFKNYQYKTLLDPSEESIKIEINFGSSNVELFSNVFAQSFETIVVVDQWPYGQSDEADLDALIRPMILEVYSSADIYGPTLLGSGLNHLIEDVLTPVGPPISSSISYQFEFVEPNGPPIVLWNISDTTTTTPPVFSGSLPSSRARVLEEQMRLIAARFLAEFPQQPEVRDWLRNKQSQ